MIERILNNKMVECKKHKLREIINKDRGGMWFLFFYIGQSNYSKNYVCEDCGKIFK